MTLQELQIYHLRHLDDEELQLVIENHNEYQVRDEAMNILNFRKVMNR